MKLYKLLLAAVGATVLLGTLVSGASARQFEVNDQHIRALFSRVEFRAAFGTTVCHVTLEGSLHSRTLSKVAETLIGYITTAILGPCERGTATILTETLPWHVRYESFTGRLPEISSIRTRVVGAAFRVREPGGITCLSQSTATEPARGIYNIGAGGTITSAEIGGTIRTSCGVSGTFTSDRGPVLILGTNSAVVVRLI